MRKKIKIKRKRKAGRLLFLPLLPSLVPEERPAGCTACHAMLVMAHDKHGMAWHWHGMALALAWHALALAWHGIGIGMAWHGMCTYYYERSIAPLLLPLLLRPRLSPARTPIKYQHPPPFLSLFLLSLPRHGTARQAREREHFVNSPSRARLALPPPKSAPQRQPRPLQQLQMSTHPLTRTLARTHQSINHPADERQRDDPGNATAGK